MNVIMRKNKKQGKGICISAEKRNSKRKTRVITSGWVSPGLINRIAM